MFTAGEQEFYAERGFQNEPQRCKACRDARKNRRPRPPVSISPPCALPAAARPAFPFEPKSDRPRVLQRVLRQDAGAAEITTIRFCLLQKERPAPFQGCRAVLLVQED